MATQNEIVPNAGGLVPVEILVSEAGLGLRAGEVRGLDPDIADAMISKKSARLVAHPKPVEWQKQKGDGSEYLAAIEAASKPKA